MGFRDIINNPVVARNFPLLTGAAKDVTTAADMASPYVEKAVGFLDPRQAGRAVNPLESPRPESGVQLPPSANNAPLAQNLPKFSADDPRVAHLYNREPTPAQSVAAEPGLMDRAAGFLRKTFGRAQDNTVQMPTRIAGVRG